MKNDQTEPKFPLRVIFDDGHVETIDNADEIFTKLVALDSTDPKNGVWVRDDLDRSVRLKLYAEELEVFEVV